MATWSFYDRATGKILPHRITAPTVDDALANAPGPDCIVIEGAFDHLSQRFDIEARCVVDFMPPSPEPSADHRWNADARRWEQLPELAEKAAARQQAIVEIERLERKQLRALREVRQNPDDAEAQRWLADYDAAIAHHQQIIRENT